MIQFSAEFCSANRMLVYSETENEVIVAGTGDDDPVAADRVVAAPQGGDRQPLGPRSGRLFLHQEPSQHITT